jgi:general L-amino acid transport system substrate-binding protein
MLVPLVILVLAFAGCTTVPAQTIEVTRVVEVTRLVDAPAGEAAVEATSAPAPAAAGAGRMEAIRQRGRVVCGVHNSLPGFGYLDADGRNAGFDIDFCRAVAVAVFNDPEAVELVPITAAERGPALQTGEIDLLSRNATWTSSRDAQWGNFAFVMFYDGQGIMVPADAGFTTLEDLDGATICVTTGTTTELNLADAPASVVWSSPPSRSRRRRQCTAPMSKAGAMLRPATSRSLRPPGRASRTRTHM